MSCTRWAVVLVSRFVSRKAAFGLLRPQLRWSNNVTLYAVGSNSDRCQAEHPEPGPPCTTSSGLPSAIPHCSQKTKLSAPTSRVPFAYGSDSGYEPVAITRHL